MRLIEEVRTLYESGVGEREVAARVGVTRHKVRSILANAGVERRSVGRPRTKERDRS
jgi:DNA-binding transcriptional regulator LsrR (DeoR family)